MTNSLTDNVPVSNGLEDQLTENEQVQEQSAEQSNQDTSSREQSNQSNESTSQESVSNETANQNANTGEQKQTEQTGGTNKTDESLVNFAKSQNINLETASDDVKRLLKVALDNQKAARNSAPKKSITDTTKELGGTDTDARIAQLEYERTTDHFWSKEGRDRSLEPTMVNILSEKAEQYGREYAFNLSRDLDTLYGLAQIENGGAVDTEAIRREERESINKQLSGSAPAAHAIHKAPAGDTKVTREWLRDVYDPSNEEHREMLKQAGLR